MLAQGGKVEITFYGLLGRIFGEGKREVGLRQAPDVRTLLGLLCESAEKRQRIFDVQGNVHSEITVLKNGRNILFLDGLDTKLSAGDTVAVFPPTHGG